MDSKYKLIYPHSVISHKISEVSLDINNWAGEVYQSTGKSVLAVCVLKGGVFFFSDLMKCLKSPVELGFCTVSSYVDNVQGQVVNMNVGHLDVRGRHVLIVDDICDTGKTIISLSSVFKESGVKEIRSAVVIYRQSEAQKSIIRPNWCCFEHIGLEWFVGYGMDDSEIYRNWPDILALQ